MYLNAAPPVDPSCQCFAAPCDCAGRPQTMQTMQALPVDRSQTLSDLATLLGVLGAVLYFFGGKR